ncbi:MAG TPA: trypsin-like peptidase domain-containing protein [Flavobacterium sp.]|uniref:trypsin-like peptidase domain-containing protein n=2 Tax=Flavobacterium TaxID=237 RepID=UPI0025BDB962|nr:MULTISPECIES: trypsin-like peptidase domain-containing protein [unclassified Flavobacterium]HRE77311.1 trypsin-like peptidase domain-containing protein [Flavobacterium sp.]
MKNVTNLFLVSLFSGVITLGTYKLFVEDDSITSKNIVTTAPMFATKNVGLSAETVDFTEAAGSALNQVVHVKNVSYRTVYNPIDFFYGNRGGQPQQQIGTGSGVIISEDGYVVTNNHVIQGATELEITLNNKKTYPAKLIGTDSKMDIALLKVETDEKLPYAVFADSDQVKVGEWVLAVGNPYNLNSTVTAGIVSAKARNLDTSGIQSFIQTDAVVNPGNSGGALVNTRGELVGINTMISSNTGSYVGYSFAVPSNITRKIIEDIMEYGNVQRGILGIEGRELNGAASKELNLTESQGFYVNKVTKNSGAEKAGIKSGDVILKLDNQNVTSFAELSGYVNTKRPNDEINVTVNRDGRKLVIPVKLTKKELLNYEFYGLELEDLEPADKQRFKLKQGVKIKDITNEKLAPYADELKGSIILSIDGVKATDVETISRGLGSKTEKEGVRVELMLRNGQVMRVIL